MPYFDFLVSSIQDKNMVYVIKNRSIFGDWYFFDIENYEPPYRVIWVPRVTPAFKFVSEQAVEEFRDEFLSPRKTEIVRIKRSL